MDTLFSETSGSPTYLIISSWYNYSRRWGSLIVTTNIWLHIFVFVATFLSTGWWSWNIISRTIYGWVFFLCSMNIFSFFFFFFYENISFILTNPNFFLWFLKLWLTTYCPPSSLTEILHHPTKSHSLNPFRKAQNTLITTVWKNHCFANKK